MAAWLSPLCFCFSDSLSFFCFCVSHFHPLSGSLSFLSWCILASIRVCPQISWSLCLSVSFCVSYSFSLSPSPCLSVSISTYLFLAVSLFFPPPAPRRLNFSVSLLDPVAVCSLSVRPEGTVEPASPAQHFFSSSSISLSPTRLPANPVLPA